MGVAGVGTRLMHLRPLQDGSQTCSISCTQIFLVISNRTKYCQFFYGIVQLRNFSFMAGLQSDTCILR